MQFDDIITKILKVGIISILFIFNMAKNAVNSHFGIRTPRSVCHVRNRENICLYWTTFDAHKLPNGGNADMAHFSANCIHAGHTVKFVSADRLGGTTWECNIKFGILSFPNFGKDDAAQNCFAEPIMKSISADTQHISAREYISGTSKGFKTATPKLMNI